MCQARTAIGRPVSSRTLPIVRFARVLYPVKRNVLSCDAMNEDESLALVKYRIEK